MNFTKRSAAVLCTLHLAQRLPPWAPNDENVLQRCEPLSDQQSICSYHNAHPHCDAQVLVADIEALLEGRPLPYHGFDMFEGEDHNIRGQVQMLDS